MEREIICKLYKTVSIITKLKGTCDSMPTIEYSMSLALSFSIKTPIPSYKFYPLSVCLVSIDINHFIIKYNCELSIIFIFISMQI